jgi:hypothetical protein
MALLVEKRNSVQDARYVHKDDNIILRHKRHFMENKPKIMYNALKIRQISLLTKNIQNVSLGVYLGAFALANIGLLKAEQLKY